MFPGFAQCVDLKMDNNLPEIKERERQIYKCISVIEPSQNTTPYAAFPSLNDRNLDRNLKTLWENKNNARNHTFLLIQCFQSAPTHRLFSKLI